VPSLALGSGEVTLLSLTSGFGAFANEGQLAAPVLIRRVTSSEGEVLYEAAVSATRAVSPATAFLITSMLQDVVNAGTAAQVRQIGLRLPAAGKTGTTSEYRDAWFVGYTSRLLTGVWVGYDRPRTIVSGGYAAQITVPLWTRFMMTATQGDTSESFRAPTSVIAAEIDRASGLRATDACRGSGDVGIEYFAQGTEPIDVCPLHRFDVLQALATAPAVPTVSSASRPPHALGHEPTPDLASPPVTQVAVEAAASPSVNSATSAKKKRGFWARVLGVGRAADERGK
jgi:membrane carboxypeptidase/penicillin-binding protein